MASEVANVLASLPTSQFATKENLSLVASGRGWLPRLQLFIASSTACKEGKFQVNRYGLVKSRNLIDDMTQQVDVMALAWRPKAADINNSVNYYNPNTPEFKKIQEGSKSFGNGCMAGPEFLIWIPSAKCFATFFMNSETAQGEAPNLVALIGRPASLKVQAIPTKKYGTYYAPLVTTCSETLAMPDPEEMRSQATAFVNPKDSEQELAEEPERDR
jgi:hypothetical protein